MGRKQKYPVKRDTSIESIGTKNGHLLPSREEMTRNELRK